ncbi:MAG: preprotein translocase subunit SecE [Candidatus Scatovivens sp.]
MAKKEKKEVIDTKITKQEKNNSKSVKKEKKNSFKNFKAELKKVTWPTPKELVNKTIAVIVIVLIIAFIVFVLDFIFENAYNFGTGKIKSAITSGQSVEDSISAEDTTGEDLNEEITNSVEDTTE